MPVKHLLLAVCLVVSLVVSSGCDDSGASEERTPDDQIDEATVDAPLDAERTDTDGALEDTNAAEDTGEDRREQDAQDNGDSGDSGDIAVDPLLDAALVGHWAGGEAIGGCIDEGQWLTFDETGAFTHGYINSNACIPEEDRGVGVCLGQAMTRSDHTLYATCERVIAGSTHAHDLLIDTTWALTSEVPGTDVLSLVAFVPTAPRTWRRSTTIVSTRSDNGQLREDTLRLDAVVRLDRMPAVSPDMAPETVIVDLEIVGEQTTSTGESFPADVKLTTSATLGPDELGNIVLAIDFPAGQNPSDAWWELLRGTPGVNDENFSWVLGAYGYWMTYEPDQDIFLSTGVSGWYPFVNPWRSSAPPCEHFAGMRTYNQPFDVYCQ